MKKFIRNSLLFCIMGIVFFYPLIYIKQILSFSELKKLKIALLKSDNDKCVIFFGSSVNKHTAFNDTDKRSIAEMLDSLLTTQKVVGISHKAYQADIYLEYVRYISKSEKKPIIIIPINLRSFSPSWDLNPGYQFTKEKYLLNGYPSIVNFKYKVIKETEYNNFPIYYQNKLVGKLQDYLRIPKEYDRLYEMRKYFIFFYMQQIKSNHRKLKSLLKICELGKENSLRIVMYITPIDYTNAEQLKIEGFRQHLCNSVNIIKSTIASYEIELLDLSLMLDSTYFDYNISPNEHLNFNGRREIAKVLKSIM